MIKNKGYSKEVILKAAIKLYKRKGFNAITARNVAKEMNCSIMPIYSKYLSIKDLKKDVVLYIGEAVFLENESKSKKEKKKFF